MDHDALKAALVELLDVDTNRYPAATQTLHLNQAIASLELDVDTQWGTATDEFDTVADQQNYSMVTDLASGSPALTFTHALGMYYLGDEGEEVVIDQVTWPELRAAYPLHADTGAPEVYAYWNNEVQLGPIPDDVYTVYVDYWGFQAALAAGNATNPWTEKAPWCVIFRAAVLACEYLLEDERINVFRARAEEEVSRLIIHLSQLEQSGRRPIATEP